MEWRGQRRRVQGGAGTGFRDAQDSAGDLERQILSGNHFDRRVPPSGLVSSLNSSTAPSDLEFGLELGGPLVRGREFRLLLGCQPWLLAAVDAVLAAPAEDRLVADPLVGRGLLHG